jgi:hypothetical protein
MEPYTYIGRHNGEGREDISNMTLKGGNKLWLDDQEFTVGTCNR